MDSLRQVIGFPGTHLEDSPFPGVIYGRGAVWAEETLRFVWRPRGLRSRCTDLCDTRQPSGQGIVPTGLRPALGKADSSLSFRSINRLEN